MPGNRQAYDQAMNAGHNAAWDQEWSLAIAAYGQAIQEFPEDSTAHIHLGRALLEIGRLEDALKVYTRANQLMPNDPIPLENSADVLERMGRLKEAAQQYINVSELYLGQRDYDKAINNWERATKLTPGLVAIHAKLAQSYERIGNKPHAIFQYLTLAYTFSRMGENEKGAKAIQRALKLDGKYAPALNMLHAIQSGGTVSAPPLPADTPEQVTAKRDLPSLDDLTRDESAIGEADPLGPMGEAMTDALGLLASYVIEGGQLDAAGGSALQGMEFQRQGLHAEAIKGYQAAVGRLNHPALKMNLGGLLLLADKPADAVQYLGEATSHPQLAAGAYQALGKAYQALGKQKQALRCFIQSLQTVDTNLAVDSREIAELTSLYERLMTTLEGRTNEALTAINNRFVNLLVAKTGNDASPKRAASLKKRCADRVNRGWSIFWWRSAAMN